LATATEQRWGNGDHCTLAFLVGLAAADGDAQSLGRVLDVLGVIQEAARVLGLPLHLLKASSASDLDAAFATLVRLRAGALIIITADGLFADRRDQIAALAARHLAPRCSNFANMPQPAA
jgi:hypothetical protein